MMKFRVAFVAAALLALPAVANAQSAAMDAVRTACVSSNSPSACAAAIAAALGAVPEDQRAAFVREIASILKDGQNNPAFVDSVLATLASSGNADVREFSVAIADTPSNVAPAAIGGVPTGGGPSFDGSSGGSGIVASPTGSGSPA